MELDALAPVVAYSRQVKMECRECGAVRPLFEWTRQKRFVAPMPAPGQPVRREDEVPAPAERTSLVCRMCNQTNWVPAHSMKEVLTLVLLLPEEALDQIFATSVETRISDRCDPAVAGFTAYHAAHPGT